MVGSRPWLAALAASLAFAVGCGRSGAHEDTARLLTPSSLGLPAGVSSARFAQALALAAAAWSHPKIPCTSVVLSVAAPAPRRQASDDGVNLVAFRGERWCHNERCGHESTFPVRAAAMTTVYPPGVGAGEVREADVELNGLHFAWQVPAPDGKRVAPLESVLVHELGHLLGFDDQPPGEAQAGYPASVMRAGSAGVELPAWDVERLCRAYPR